MDDKVYNLLVKMYSDFTGKFDNMEKRLIKIETVLENDVIGVLEPCTIAISRLALFTYGKELIRALGCR